MRSRRPAAVVACISEWFRGLRSWASLAASVGEALFHAQFRRRQRFGDSHARAAIAVQPVARRPAVAQVVGHGGADLVSIVIDVGDVLAALPTLLARPDIDGWHAKKRTLANGDA